MSDRIKEIIGVENHQTYANVHVLTDKGVEAVVYIGGTVEVFYDAAHDKIKAYVKRTIDK